MAINGSRASEGHHRYFFLFARFKSNRRTRGNVEPHSVGGRAIKDQRLVDFKEMIMAAGLNRPVACVANHDPSDGPPLAQFDLAVGQEIFSGMHAISLLNWIVNGQQLGAVRDGCFYVDLVNLSATPSIASSRWRMDVPIAMITCRAI